MRRCKTISGRRGVHCNWNPDPEDTVSVPCVPRAVPGVWDGWAVKLVHRLHTPEGTRMFVVAFSHATCERCYKWIPLFLGYDNTHKAADDVCGCGESKHEA